MTLRQPRIPVWAIFLGILLFYYLIVTIFFPSAPPRIEVPYTLFRDQVQSGNVERVATRQDILQGTFIEPVVWPEEPLPTLFGQTAEQEVLDFSTTIPAFVDPGLEELLLVNNVEINAESLQTGTNPFVTFLIYFGPTLLLIGLFWFISRRAQAGMGSQMSMGNSKAKRYDKADESNRVTFEDVAGIEEAEAELTEIVDFLKNPEKYTRLGGTVPRGVLLIGQPGTGKTLLAKAVAGEADVPFFSMNASEFVEMIVGVGASRVRDLFKQAREAAPAIIFIDELDAIGKARGSANLSGSHSEQEQALNQILTEMDGFGSNETVIVLAATNRPDVLDPALMRAGRFDRRVTVQPPDKVGRAAILEVHTRKVPLDDDVDLKQIASLTPGLVGADLRNLVNEAALLAARLGREKVTNKDFTDSLEKIVLGPVRQLYLKPEDRERVAYHEAGHAILGLVIPEADPVTRVTITPRGQSLGVTYQRPEDDRYNYSDGFLKARIVGALGGRAAEELVYGDRTTGASNDLEQVTSMARNMVTRWGMSDTIGPVALAPQDDQGGYGMIGKPFSEATAKAIDGEIRRIIEESEARAMELLKEYRAELDSLAQALLESESLDEEEVKAVTGLPRSTAV